MHRLKGKRKMVRKLLPLVLEVVSQVDRRHPALAELTIDSVATF